MKEIIYAIMTGIVIGMILMFAIVSGKVETMKLQMGGLALMIERANK